MPGPWRGVLHRGALQAGRVWDRPMTAYYLVAGSAALIAGLGLVMVYSASQIQALRYGLPSTFYLRRQVLAAAIGLVLLLSVGRMPVRWHRLLTYPLSAAVMLLLGLVQVPGLGRTVNGSTNWLALGGPFVLQPSEFGKLAFVLWGADLLARKQRHHLLGEWKHLLVPLVPGGLLLVGLVLLGGDMGTAVILCAVLLGLLWIGGAPLRLFVTVLAGAGVLAGVLITTSGHRVSRFACLGASDPGPGDQCWQVVHGLYALSTGGLFGDGIGASVEKWGQLPEPHTDFIFAVTGEELGLLGTLSVLGLLAALCAGGLQIAARTADPFVRFASGGVVTWIAVQASINIGGVLGLVPIAGVPLPLFSFGGSALISALYAVGLLLSLARNEPSVRTALAARRGPGVLAGVARRPWGTGHPAGRRHRPGATAAGSLRTRRH
ncbi:peptidoglycan glycosyltransferase FtsW [Streptomyces tropicalis]|uniref:Probable peptidoglycan glycosyltransferase FtsW n=1 Tax=Streptomyces tropicalis TaxID=3034234 RepID=A0ABT6A6D1_9ACTN|nr:putative peptidoglycan glycosyltransferase FtsW [Streptomyces tropicalis]MDF3300188.1 putative peptidoglycan glycosyltransferase FtsW [Streptomyces tropicalis]